MEQMNPQILSAVRSMLIATGGLVVGMGWIDNATMTTIVGAVTAIAPAMWSLWQHRPTGIIAQAAALPTVHKIVTDQKIANSPKFIANPTVVSRE